jgi:hypothetical protein
VAVVLKAAVWPLLFYVSFKALHGGTLSTPLESRCVP